MSPLSVDASPPPRPVGGPPPDQVALVAAAGAVPLRVVQIVTTLARGGAQATVLASLPPAGSGIEVTILAGTDDPGEGTHWAEVGPDGVVSGARVVAMAPLRRRLRPVADLWALVWLVRWLRRHRPDVVHTHSSKAGVVGRLAALLAGVPAVHTVHGWSFAALPVGPDAPPARRAARWAVVILERALARGCRALVVVTPLDAELGLAEAIGTAERYHVIRSGVDLGPPRAGPAERDLIRAREGWDGRFVVGTVGRLAPQKDLATLVTGFARADLAGAAPGGAVLVVVGDGPQRRELVALATALGVADRVQFLGMRSDAACIVAAFDVFALTSRWEGLPRTVVEAAAAGVPVVATAVGGVPELIRPDDTGILIPVGDPGAVASALVAVAADPARHRIMAERGAEAVAGFSVEVMRADLARLWRDVAGGA